MTPVNRVTRMTLAALTLWLVSLPSGCVLGSRVASFEAAQSARGARGEIVLTDGAVFEGELVGVREDGLLLLGGTEEIVLIPFDLIDEADFGDTPGIPDSPRFLAPVSRYPFGVDEALLHRLLEAAGQGELRIVGTRVSPSDASAASAFLAQARGAALGFADLDTAIRAGYRKLGPDFPGMGEHWVHIGHVVSGRFDPSRPPVLNYVRVHGEPKLVGLAYALPLRPDELPPASPFGRDVWHDHVGEILEESVLLDHPSTVSGTGPGFRLSVLHVWVPLENPGGILAQNNWLLPFSRVGLEVSPPVSTTAARAVSLSSGSSDYFRDVVLRAADLGPEEAVAAEAALDSMRRDVDDWIERRRGAAVQPEALSELEHLWHGFWTDLQSVLDSESFERVSTFAGPEHPEH